MEIKKFGWVSMICAAIVMGSGLTSCSDDDNTGNGNTEEPKVIYDGTTAVSEGILFNKGTELGSGDQEFVFTGDVTLEKGTYLLKGWVYIASGAKLRIPAGTIIKGDKQTKAALIVEPGGYVEMKGTKEAPIVMTSEEAPGNRKPGDWGGLIICGKAKNNEGTKQKVVRVQLSVVITTVTIPVSINTSAWNLPVIRSKQTRKSTESLLVLSVAVQPSTTYKYLIPTMILTNGSAVR